MNKIKSLFLVCLGAATFAGAAPFAEGACKFLGNITTGGQVRSDFGNYWNQITAENECKWQSIEGSRGNYNWSGCDAAYNWAKNNGGHFKFHALLWGSQYPNWLGSLDASATKDAITAWFDAVAKHYPDLEMIDVANEAIRTGNNQYHSGYANTKIREALGGDNGDYAFLVTAFKMARERWPNAILIYNDYNTIQWDADKGIDLIKTIKKGGAPVDAYGLQAHDMMTQGGGAGGTGGGGGCLSLSTLKSTMEKIWNETQTPMLISEYDIFTDDDRVQKQCYEEQISYFMENEHVAGITLWGYIYGQTWNNGTSGIIKNGSDRSAMTWLKEYFGAGGAGISNCQNSTGLAGGQPVDPVPQQPYGTTVASLPGKIEIENFDISGKGKDENGVSNISFSEGDSENHGDSDYRADEKTGVDFYKGGTGVVIGYTNAGEWYEYTVNVAEESEYTLFASVASGNATSSFKIYVDDKDVSGEIAVPQTADGSWDVYEDVKVPLNGKISAGKHVIKFEVVGAYVNVDYLNFVKGANAEPPSAIGQNVNMAVDQFSLYDIFDIQGVHVGRLGAYNMEQAVYTVKNGNLLSKGVYQLRNRNTGKIQTLRIAK